ncbi:MAG: hypothetical protein J7K88_07475 [Candidatus Fermentibacteraceae bacterium]|nr:hypothetical protein [Candidatus Fermentibacteraceae bacterium]
MGKLGYILTVLLMFAGLCYADWLEFNAGCPSGTLPSVSRGVTEDDYISFDVELQGLLSETLTHDNIDYLRFNQSPGTVPMDETGFPEVPFVTCFVAVPDGVDLDLSFHASCEETVECLPVYPAPCDSLVHEHGVTFIDEFFERDQAAYSSSEWYPSVTAEISGEFRLRDQRVAIVNVYPVQFLASENRLRVWSDIEVKVNFQGTDPVWNQAGLGYYDQIIGNRLIGYEPDATPIPMGLPGGSVFRHENTLIEPPFVPDYVIIVAPGLDGSFVDDFAAYRAALNGFDVLIANLTAVMDGYGDLSEYVTPDIIRDYTEALWNWGTPGDRPTYLLLIGDHEEVSCTSYPYRLPTKEQGSPEGYANDEWLVLFDEPREVISGLPDMIVGRFPVRDADTLQDMFDLIESYESEAVPPYPENLVNRRRITRLAGTDHDGAFTYDDWKPSVGWTDSLRTWMGYEWDNYYCGDGEDTYYLNPPNPDGSSMTSDDWVDACNTVFERGSQVAFYSDHGDFHMFSAGLNWIPPVPDNFGAPCSTFDDIDVLELTPDGDHWTPFVLMLCCSSGTFNHTEDEHENINIYQGLCYDRHDSIPYDFHSDCLAEDFVYHTNCGAIGVFAGSNSSGIQYYVYYGKGILSAVFEKGITRTGDAILSSRLQYLDVFMSNGTGVKELAQFNLLGDPAVDIGDRMKFRDCCDLIIAPSAIEMNSYPTMRIDGSSQSRVFVTVRNAGWQDAGPFTVSLEITDGIGLPDILTAECIGLSSGDETTLEFQWNNTWFTPPGILYLTASASDPGGSSPDSWMPNNSATKSIEIQDFYPNESGWPFQMVQSTPVPPVLCDFDGGGDLEIVVTAESRIQVFRSDSPGAPIWETGEYSFFNMSGREVWPTIPVAGNVVGNSLSEIIVDGPDDLMIFDRTSSEPVCSFEHSGPWSWHKEHTVALADLVDESDLAERDEIVLVRGPDLYIFDIVNDALVLIRTVQLPGIPPNAANFSSWPLLEDLNSDGNPEIIVRIKWSEIMDVTKTGCFIYDYSADAFLSNREWTGTVWNTVPAVGTLPQGQAVALPTDLATSEQNPVLLLDAEDLSTSAECQSNPNLDSFHVPYCIMADWEPLTPGPDRIIANTENQCFVWHESGLHVGDFPHIYSSAGAGKPPFPALGELDDHDGFDYADLVVATREGTVFGLSSDGDPLDNLGFPYTLPSSVQGGFVIADIDNDGKVEVVFGTMDNYLHVWELGSCPVGYTPWPQCQHDAARTGVLKE